MANYKYKNQLKDPQWQRKRLEIFKRDNFTCQNCGDKTSTLHVHHKYYEKGSQIWEYDDNVLITLCEKCHIIEHDGILYAKETAESLINDLMLKGFPSNAIAYFFDSLIMAYNNAVCISDETKDTLNEELGRSVEFAKEMLNNAKIEGKLNLRI